MIEPTYHEHDTVRVVTTDTPFFGWTGRIVGGTEQWTDTPHYYVRMDAWGEESQALLFREGQLQLEGRDEEGEKG